MSGLDPPLAPTDPAARPALHGPRARFALAGLAGTAAAAGAAVGLVGAQAGALAAAVAGYGLGVSLALGLMRRDYPHDRVGAANLVTLLRLALAAALLAPLAAPALPGAVFAVAAVALALDGVDGALARRLGPVSDFGASFDMEVDSALALILALNAWAAGTAGAAVLLLGLPRYAFGAAALVLPWLDRPLPPSLARKAVCVLQIGALIALQLPQAAAWAGPLLAAAALALAWSFARDIARLWRHRA
jgi:phosphatidylglycerophosphate synthase